MKAWIAHEAGIAEMGEIPEDVTVEVFPGGDAYPSDPATVDFWAPPFLSRGETTTPLNDLTGLQVVQLLSAGAEVWTPIVPHHVTLCDAMGVHTGSTAEWVVAATLASLRRFDVFARQQAHGDWTWQPATSLAGKRVLIVGAGDIGTAIAKRIAPFEADIALVARRARDGVHGVSQLPDLLPHSDVVVLIVPLTEATRGMVDADFLARLPDDALLVNAARGPVVDTAALLAELRSGRIRAAVDVTDPEPLPRDHPLWTLPNILITPHIGGGVAGAIPRAYRLVGEQLRRFATGSRLANVVTEGY
jgi:phosphoglycerate dehydrogenase-like enzyme